MEPTEAEAAAEVWWKDHSAQYLAASNLKQVFAAGYAAGKRMYHVLKEAGPVAAEPGFLEKTFRLRNASKPDDNPAEDE